MRHRYRTDKISFSLRTRSASIACQKAQRLAETLDQHWFAMQISEDVTFSRYLTVGGHSVMPTSKHDDQSNRFNVFLSDAAVIYCQMKGLKRSKTFHSASDRAVAYLTATCGNKVITEYTRKDANLFRDNLVNRGLAGSSIDRIIGTIRAICNFTFSEYALNHDNPFEKVQFDRTLGVKTRETIPVAEIRKIQEFCNAKDDEARWLIALISDTGLRLAEAAGALKSDLVVQDEVPHIVIKPYPWRSLKTKSSERLVPLVGQSLWAAQQILAKKTSSPYAFPKYNKSAEATSTNSASAALNKWIKTKTSSTYTIHGFRHAMRDRLRAVECPSEIIDQIGGWATVGVGSGYGTGYGLTVTGKWMKNIQLS